MAKEKLASSRSMSKIPHSALPLAKVAKLWANDPLQPREEAELYTVLVRDFGRGELIIVTAKDRKRAEPRTVLEALSQTRDHPGLSFVERGDPGYARRESPVFDSTKPSAFHTSVSVEIRLVLQVLLPLDPEQWTNEIVVAAWALIATADRFLFDESARAVFDDLFVTKDALGDYCDLREYARPQFWFAAPTRLEGIKHTERRVGDWLRELCRARKQKSKAGYFDEALKSFPDLSRKSFDRVWRKVVPDSWKRVGRPPLRLDS